MLDIKILEIEDQEGFAKEFGEALEAGFSCHSSGKTAVTSEEWDAGYEKTMVKSYTVWWAIMSRRRKEPSTVEGFCRALGLTTKMEPLCGQVWVPHRDDLYAFDGWTKARDTISAVDGYVLLGRTTQSAMCLRLIIPWLADITQRSEDSSLYAEALEKIRGVLARIRLMDAERKRDGQG